jgi:predicted O-methyltransferase YrrM
MGLFKDTIFILEEKNQRGQMINFDIDSSKGQMTPKQRRMLYNMVLGYNPAVVLEVGTWRGYGSTYTILEALDRIDDCGKLITYEIDPDTFAEAKSLYDGELKHLSGILEMNLGNVLDNWPKEQIGFAWLDGGDDPQQALTQVEKLFSSMAYPKIIGCHDWCGEKMTLARPLLEKVSITIEHDYSGVGIWFGQLR